MEHKSIGKNVIFNVVRVACNMLFPLLIFPYISRVLGPENLGKVDFCSSIISYFILFSSMGIPSYGIIAVAKCRNNPIEFHKTICELLYINLCFTILSYAILGILTFRLEQFHNYKSLLLINSLNIIFTTIGVEWLYGALEEFQYIAIRSFLFKLISLIAIFIFIQKNDDYLIYMVINVFSVVGANLFNFIHAKQHIRFYRPQNINIKRHFKPIGIFFFAALAGSINANLDITMLGLLKGNYFVGIYSFSIKIKAVLTSIMTAGLMTLIPRFSNLYGKNKIADYQKILQTALLLTFSGSIVVCSICLLSSDNIIEILGGKKYLEAKIPILIWSVCLIVLSFTWTLGVGVLQVVGKEKYYTKTIVISALINLILNFSLIPFWGVTGAAIATLFTEIANAILFYVYSRFFVKDLIKQADLYKLLILAIISGLITFFLKKTVFSNGLLIQFFLSSITFACLYLCLSLYFHPLSKNFIMFFIKKIKKNGDSIY